VDEERQARPTLQCENRGNVVPEKAPQEVSPENFSSYDGRISLEREATPEGERWWARRWLRLEAIADSGIDQTIVQRAYRSWRNLVHGLVSQPDLSFELRLDKSEDRVPPKPSWSLAYSSNTSDQARRGMWEREQDCRGILASASHLFRFQGAAGEEPTSAPTFGHRLELGRRLEWFPGPTGRRILLPCPWIPVGSMLDELSEALTLQPGRARWTASLRQTTLTPAERAFLGYGGVQPSKIGFRAPRRRRGTLAVPPGPSLFELRVRLETAAEASLACMHQLGAVITDPTASQGPLEEQRFLGGFLWDEPGRTASLMELPHLYYLYDLNQVMAVFPLPLSSRTDGIPGARAFFPVRDKAPLETRGSSLIGLDASRSGRAPLSVDSDRRREHLFVLGATGTGKSNLLQHLSLQSIRRGAATVVIDFHGDLCEAILARLQPEDGERLIYFNTADVEYPIGLNLLAGYGDPGRHWLVWDRAIQSLLCLFEKLWPKDFMGPIFQMNIKNAIQLVLASPDGATLLDVPLCFIGPRRFRQTLLRHVTNPLVRNFWTRTYEQTTDYHKSEHLQYIISKLTPLLENDIMRNIVGQPSCFDFHRILEEKQILLCSLNKGIIGEQHAALLATILMQKLEEAVYARARVEPARREDAFAYIDEVHNLAAENVAHLVSESRKFGVCLTLATQVLEQLGPKMRDVTLGNASTLVCFRVGAADAAIMAEYFRTGLEPSLLTRLPNYTAAVRLLVGDRPRYAVAETLPPEPPAPPAITDQLREQSRKRHGRPRQAVEAEIFQRLESQTDDRFPS
jgi:hypothetical protein